LLALTLGAYSVHKYLQEEETFGAKLQKIADHVNSNNYGWKATTYDHFDKMTQEDFVRKNLMHPKFTQKQEGKENPFSVSGGTPEHFNSKDNWTSCSDVIGHIWDQGYCGSCWAVGASGAISDRLCIHKGSHTPVSSQDLTSCCTNCGYGCNGGYPLAAWEYWQESGLVSGGDNNITGTCWPYEKPRCSHHVKGSLPDCGASGETEDTPRCRNSCSNAHYTNLFNDDKVYGASAYNVGSNEGAIKNEVYHRGPIEVSFSVYEDFPTYRSGVYTHSSGGYLGGHAVRLVGWGVDGSTPYWIIANSWNETWGNKGYFWIKRGTDECGIEGSPVAGMPA